MDPGAFCRSPAAHRVKEPCLTWQSWEAARAKRTDSAHWVDNIGKRCPPSFTCLYSQAAGWSGW